MAFLRAAILTLSYLTTFILALSSSPVTVHDTQHNLTYIGYNYAGVENFQNIRYGQDTTGDNRFKHPKPFAYPTGTTVRATAAGASCPQNTIQSFVGFTQNPGVYEMSEDCLNLRVARAKGTKAGAGLGVLVWIYGGGDETGSANYTLYDPTSLVLGAAQKGTPVVFVAMNYRLNVFGFANSQALRKEGSLNSGLLDQRLALEWIANNIEAFGGDPNKVTLFGQSDGGVGIGLQLTSYGGKGKPYFHRAIMESGSPSGDTGTTSNITVSSTSTVAELAGCPGTNSTKVLTCLRKVPMPKLLNAVLKYENITKNETSQDIFFPTVDGDFLPAAPSTLLAKGEFHKNISAISGWTYNDGSIFTPPTLSSTAEVDGFLQASYPGFTAVTRKFVLAQYPLSDFVQQAATLQCSPYFLQAAQVYRDLNFACPNIAVAKYVSQYGADSWLYELNTTTFDSLLVLGNAAFEGVIHISDVPFVFNHADIGLGITAAQNVTQRRMSGSWANFAARGTPSGSTETTLAGWTTAFPRGSKGVLGKGLNETNVRVIGGPKAGMGVLSVDGGVDPGVFERCAKIFTGEVLEQFGA